MINKMCSQKKIKFIIFIIIIVFIYKLFFKKGEEFLEKWRIEFGKRYLSMIFF